MNFQRNMHYGPEAPVEEQRICVGCGCCCDGTLFVNAGLNPGERGGLPGQIIVCEAGHPVPDAAGEIDWTLHFVDSTIVRAHQHAAGAKGGTPLRRRWATARAASRPRSTSEPKATDG